MFEINRDKCVKCGKCERVCPFTCITMEEEYPEMVKRKIKACVKCCHCAAICPTEALSFPNMPCKSIKIKAKTEKDYIETKELIMTRRSIRNFKKTPVPIEIIEEIIRVSDYSPSAKNLQPQSWLVVHNPEKVDKIMELIVEWVNNKHISMEILSELENNNNIVTLGAPHLLIGCGPKDSKFNHATDIAIALRDIDLLMHSKGLGACWAGYLTRMINSSAEIRALLGIGEDLNVYGALAFGFPDDESYQRLPYRKNPQIIYK